MTFAQSDKAYLDVHKIHQQYGDIARIGPRFVSINNVEALAPVYGVNSVCTKSVQYEMGQHRSLQVIRDFDEHHARRTIWDKGLNARVCQDFVPRMSRLTDLFVDKVASYNGQPLVINDWCHYVTFDVTGDLGFGSSYGQLEAGRLHPGVAAISEWLKFASLGWQLPWLMSGMSHIPGIEDPTTKLRNFAEKCLREREKVRNPTPCMLSSHAKQLSTTG